MVQFWAERASDSDFVWRAADDNADGAIIVGPASNGSGVAVHSGQHRILGGLMTHRPVPRSVMTGLSIEGRSVTHEV